MGKREELSTQHRPLRYLTGSGSGFSSRLSCGEYAGSTNSGSRPSVDSTNCFTALAAVGGVAVDDQVDRSIGVSEELASELDEPGGGEAAGVGGKPQQPLRGHR